MLATFSRTEPASVQVAPSEPDSAETRDLFRAAMRGHGSTVTLITTRLDGQDKGITATAMMSLSMEPPSIAVAINKASSLYPPLKQRGELCVNILKADQKSYSDAFFKMPQGEARFASPGWEISPSDLPYLKFAQANLFCRVTDSIEFGSHILFIAEVQNVVCSNGADPLLYCDGQYTNLTQA